MSGRRDDARTGAPGPTSARGPVRSRRALALGLALALASCTRVGGPASDPPPPARTPDVAEAAPAPPAATPEPADAVPARGAPPVLRPVRRFEEVRGLWVVRSSMTSRAEVLDVVRRAADAGFNTLLVQVRGRGDAFYRSSIEPRAETLADAPADFDPLALAIEEGHRRGLAVHAWVNTHLVWGPTARPRDPRHIVNEHPEWLAVPRALADELRDVPPGDPRFFEALRAHAARNGATVEGLYTSPSHPEVQDRVHAVWMELLERYDLDGLHFDYVRYPSAQYDYAPHALGRFGAWLDARSAPADGGTAADGGAPAPHGRSPRSFAARSNVRALPELFPEAWGDFRRSEVTALVRRIYHDVKARRPEVVVSAAVVADAEEARVHRFQDWAAWLEEGILDIAVPMAYTTDGARFDRMIAGARGAAGERRRVWAGIGAWLNGLDGTLGEIDVARARDVGGLVLFSYDWAITEGSAGGPFLERVGRARFGAP